MLFELHPAMKAASTGRPDTAMKKISPAGTSAKTMFGPNGITAKSSHRRRHEEDRRRPHQRAVCAGGCERLFLHQLDRVGDRLQQAEGPHAIRPLARLDASDDAPLAVHPHEQLRRQDEDDEGRHEADDRRHDVGQFARRDLVDPLEDHARQVREVAEVVPVVRREYLHQRSISPTTISTEPSATIASAIEPPTVISRKTLRLMSDGGRMWKR